MLVDQKVLDALLKAIGLEDVEVVGEGGEEVKVDDLVARIDTNRSAILKPQITEEVKGELDPQYKAKMYGSIKTAFSRIGVKLDKEYKSVDELVKEAVGTYDTKFSNDTESLRNDMKEMSEKHTKELTDKEAEWQKKLDDEKNKFVDRDIEEILQGRLKSIPRLGGDEISQSKMAKQYLRDKYHIHYDPETREIELRQKDAPEKNAYNATKTAFLSVDEELRQWCETMGVIAKDARHENPKVVMDDIQSGGRKQTAINTNRQDNGNLNPIEANKQALDNFLGKE